MKRSKLTPLITVCMLLLASACLRDDSSNIAPREQSFIVSYSLKGSQVNQYATIPAEEGESDVSMLYLFFFEHSAGGTGKFIDCYNASPPEGQTYSLSGEIKINFDATPSLNMSTDYIILFLANDQVDMTVTSQLYKEKNATLNDALKDIYGFGGDTDEHKAYSYPNNYDNIPFNSKEIFMSGYAEKKAGANKIDVELVRMMARVDVDLQAANYKLASVSLWNLRKITNVWDNNLYKVPETYTKRSYGVKNSITNNQIRGGLYAFENVVVSPTYNDEVTTCVVVGIEKDGSVSHYRININVTGAGQIIRRNNAYKITISSVYGKGFTTEREAYEYASEAPLSFNINGWTLDNQGNIQYDGDNILAVPVSQITFTPHAETRTYQIFTLGEGTLQINQSSLSEGLSVDLSGSTLTVSATESYEERSGIVEVKFGKLKSTINIKQTSATEVTLKLSEATLPMFPETSGQASSAVTVTSSGSWIAELFSDSFSFNSSAASKKIEGTSGQSFKIYTQSANSAQTPLYSFVLVSLKDDTQVNRTIVLSQKGSQGITLNPSTLSKISFDANGGSIDNEFEFDTGGAEYMLALSNGSSSSFTVTDALVSGTKRKVTVSIKGTALNTTAADKNDKLVIYLKNATAVRKEILVDQKAHTLLVSPSSIATIPTEGGVTPNLTVNTTGSWKAYVSSGNIAGATLSKTQGISGEQFKVALPALTSILSNPEVKVTIAVVDNTGTIETNVKTTITIRQAQIAAKSITIMSMCNYFGTLYPYDQPPDYKSYTSMWGASLTAASKFGTSGALVKIPYPGVQHALGEAYDYLLGIERKSKISHSLESGDIFVYASRPIDSDVAKAILEWLGANSKRVLIVNSEINGPEYAHNLIINSNSTKQSGIGKTYTINHSTYNVSNNKLYSYLFKDGPATNGQDISTLVSLKGGNGYENYMTNYNNEKRGYNMIPIIMNPGSTPAQDQMVLGIDPVNRIVYCGNYLLFSNSASLYSSVNWADDEKGKANQQFLDNLNAWIINAAMYGDAFTKDYWIENQLP